MAYIDDTTTQKANLRFIKASMRTPLLSRDREFELARRWREEHDDRGAARAGARLYALVIADRRRAFAVTACRWATSSRKAMSG